MKREKFHYRIYPVMALVLSAVIGFAGCRVVNLKNEHISHYADTTSSSEKSISSSQNSNPVPTTEEMTNQDYHISYTTPFSGGYAWVRLSQNMDQNTVKYYYGIIDTNGDICFLTDEDFSPSDFSGGSSLLTYQNGVKKVVDTTGAELFSSGSDICDDILAYGKGFYLGYKYYEDFNDAGYRVFILNNDLEEVVYYDGLFDELPTFVYCGDGVFARKFWENAAAEVTWQFLDANTGGYYEIGKIGCHTSVENIFNNGYAVIEGPREGDLPRLVTTSGDITELDYFGYGCFYDFGPVSDGGCVCISYNYSNKTYGDVVENVFFYDIATGETTVLGNYGERVPRSVGTSLKFDDGYMLLPLEGADGNAYYTVLDKDGNSLFEPKECVYVKSLQDLLLIQYNDRSTLTNLRGEELFENTENWSMHPFSEGWASVSSFGGDNYMDAEGELMFPNNSISANAYQADKENN